ncbi:MAG: hypothetical protein AVDCRST_MAG30-1377 [uncultured Solirubrobacteraceae bacterium]|uniref:Uncharacterized protein n=1 Tax=uncultured Solirubrobacteraceae bacterium TaxID=1162706 RepID=A0A6J4SGN5_9ACTN|nr:MAG: hypothetical protein AVDCRST_MAG30-1377 [uncultured Solirubrobacteraceae bacterium]
MTREPSELTPEEALAGDDAEDTRLLREMARQARRHLESQSWCERVTDLRFGDGVGGIAAVFLARLIPAQPGADAEVWVVVGDIPPLHLVVDDLPDPTTALQAFVDWRRDWVAAVRGGGSLEGLPPVDAPPTRANADDLARRLDYIEREIIATER